MFAEATRVILVRHGQTAWNEGRSERLRGRADIELDREGRDQAWATGRRISQTEKMTTIYTSPLKRAVETACIIGGQDRIRVEIAEGLTDIDYGKWQGLTLEEARSDNGHTYDLWLTSPHLVTFPGGEDLEMVRGRAMQALQGVVLAHAGETVLLVSHKVVCKVLICTLLGLEMWHFWQIDQDLCAVNILEGTPKGFTVVRLNDTCHLKGLL